MEYDLEERTLKFAHEVRQFAKSVKKTLINADDIKQMIRSSGSVGANYIEANEALSKKDFYYRIKVSRKEVKETRYWLTLLNVEETEPIQTKRKELMDECTQLIKIFTKILKSNTEG